VPRKYISPSNGPIQAAFWQLSSASTQSLDYRFCDQE